MITLNFIVWFNADCYGGVACCLFAIAVSVCSKILRRDKASNYHFAVTIALCVVSILLLLPAMLWFHADQMQRISVIETWGILVYVFVCGWLIPLAAAIVYCLLARPYPYAAVTSASSQSPGSDDAGLQLPRYQHGQVLPYVFGDDIPWGWLEYKNGRFQGQRLALKRIVAMLGRDENCDIWLDDDMASRYHAELAWYDGKCCLTDCGSMNGVLLNGKRIHGSVIIEANSSIEIGSQHFSFMPVEKETALKEQYDPLVNHTWRSSLDLQSSAWPAAIDPLSHAHSTAQVSVETDQVLQVHDIPQESGYLVLQNGQNMGQRFPLSGQIITIGCDSRCSIVLHDPSISQMHVQILCSPNGLLIQAVAGSNRTFLNGEVIMVPQLLKVGDVISMGNVMLAYGKISHLPNTTMPPIPIAKSMSGPVPLRLPSKIKFQ